MFRVLSKSLLLAGALAFVVPTVASARNDRVQATKQGIANKLNSMFHRPSAPWTAKDVKIRTKPLAIAGGPTFCGVLQRKVTFKADKEILHYRGTARSLTSIVAPGGPFTSVTDIQFTSQPLALARGLR